MGWGRLGFITTGELLVLNCVRLSHEARSVPSLPQLPGSGGARCSNPVMSGLLVASFPHSSFSSSSFPPSNPGSIIAGRIPVNLAPRNSRSPSHFPSVPISRTGSP